MLLPLFQIRLVVRHIPGRVNVLVDSLSRSLAPVNTEWELQQPVFQSIVLHWRNPKIDLFATSLNFKVTTFVSPVPDPRVYAVDAMSLSWEGMFAYAVDAMSLSWEGMFAYAFPHSDFSLLFFTK